VGKWAVTLRGVWGGSESNHGGPTSKNLKKRGFLAERMRIKTGSGVNKLPKSTPREPARGGKKPSIAHSRGQLGQDRTMGV